VCKTMDDCNVKIIEQYVAAYNAMDIARMVNLLHPDIVFRNYSNGEMNTETQGLQAFRQLAEQSVQLFSSRKQTITSYSARGDVVEIAIDYEAVLAVDLPNGMKSGEKLQLAGNSLFRINYGTIALIEDYS
jgi:ketosteroid isomerase-like protein